MRAPTPSPRTIRFGPFIANLRSGELYKGSEKLKLQEQPFEVLRMLLERAGQVVMRQELREKLWGNDTFVDFDHGINMTIGKIREALDDSSDEPRFVETVGKRGYRFIGAVELSVGEGAALPRVFPGEGAVPQVKRRSVGREKEGHELRAGFESVEAGRGLLLCVAGEAGIGKTTLVEDFLVDLAAARVACLVGRGRCSERLAGMEAYLPILEALESLSHGKAGGSVARVMRRVAPMWYAQVAPCSVEGPANPSLRTEVRPTSQERLKRELIAFLREVSQTRPLVLFLEDMQWADVSTVDLLAYIGGKLDSVRALIVAT